MKEQEMDYKKYLQIAGVEDKFFNDAIHSLKLAEERADGLNMKKWKVRLFKAGEIADMLAWEDERLVDKSADKIDWDIAPMLNITAHGDNVPWAMTPEGGRPVKGAWLNKDPNSQEYQDAIKANYWKEGTHPRSKESRKAWYARNGGEGLAWRLGHPVNKSDFRQKWSGKKDKLQVDVYCSGNAWLIKYTEKWFGSFGVKGRVGFEVDNVFRFDGTDEQLWYPIDGYELRAPVTNSSIPGKI